MIKRAGVLCVNLYMITKEMSDKQIARSEGNKSVVEKTRTEFLGYWIWDSEIL